MSLPHGMTIEPNFLHDLYYGEYEPSVFKEQDKKQQVLNHTVSAAETALRGELSKLLQLWQLSRCTKRPPVSATAL